MSVTAAAAPLEAPRQAPGLTPAYDLERVRADFPILARRIHGKPLVYLDNAATTHKPRQVVDAIARCYAESYANVGRGIHLLSVEATALREAARATVQRFLGAASPAEVVFVRGTTEAINLVASSYGQRLGPGDEVIVTAMEHHSNIVPWQLLRDQRGVRLLVAPFDERGELRMDELERLLSPRTSRASFSLYNTAGEVDALVAGLHKVREVFG
jgi:cysteine desulfurase/selenocysteine lyase